MREYHRLGEAAAVLSRLRDPPGETWDLRRTEAVMDASMFTEEQARLDAAHRRLRWWRVLRRWRAKHR